MKNDRCFREYDGIGFVKVGLRGIELAFRRGWLALTWTEICFIHSLAVEGDPIFRIIVVVVHVHVRLDVRGLSSRYVRGCFCMHVICVCACFCIRVMYVYICVPCRQARQ